jgi:hypothetical protein
MLTKEILRITAYLMHPSVEPSQEKAGPDEQTARGGCKPAE